ncbi:hypothetical protein GQ543_09380 [candidate division WOR-3 bacterium]|nr:hypothetical protein [candidate division WOR-3 bacterium]
MIKHYLVRALLYCNFLYHNDLLQIIQHHRLLCPLWEYHHTSQQWIA